MLLGKNAVITGSRRGIGRQTVECFAQYGANVWACARKSDETFESDMKAIAEKHNVWIKPVYFDLNDEEEIKAAFKKITADKLNIDILVNNGAVPHGGLLQMTPISDIRKIFNINFFSQLLLMQLVSRKMARQKSGSIVNVSSVEGLEGNPGYIAYGSSKAALAFATKVAARELAQYNIRVNAVAPGIINTEMGGQMNEAAREKMLEKSAFHRMGEPNEIAETIAFLSSDKASLITGQILRADGGM